MRSIGITGGIGSGKSTICRVFETLGVPVFYADAEAKKIQNEDETVRNAIIALFGNEVYSTEGLNRKLVAEKVFADKNLLEQLNKIVHPATITAFEKWQEKNADKPYCLKEAAILFETGIADSLDKIIVVTAPDELKINRIIERDKSTREEVIARMKNQLSDEEKIKRADFVIVNDEKQAIIPQIMKVHKALLATK
ncbi:MAG: dephospho-CoA kinase [Bacteroidota bacterium]